MTKPQSKRIGLIARLINLFGNLALMGTLLGFAASYFWIADAVIQLRVQYLILLIPAVVLWLFQRRPILLAVGVVALAVNSWTIVPYYLPQQSHNFAASDPPRLQPPKLRLVVFNVLRTNESIKETLAGVVDEDADLIFLMEVAPAWEAPLQALRQKYPHQKLLCRHDYTGVAFLSKHPWEQLKIVDTGDANPPLDILFPPVAGQLAGFRLLVTHPLPPMGGFLTVRRDRQLLTLAEGIDRRRATLFAGDFNLVPWSPRFQKLLSVGHLRDSSLGFGISPTLTPLPTVMGGLKVDHVLVNSQVIIADYRVHSSAHSDHQRLVVDFEIAEPTR